MKHTTCTRTIGAILAIAGLALLAPITPAHAQTYTVLYNFGSKSGDPTGPQYSGIIAQGRDGNLYSSADDHWTDGLGTAFKITPKGSLTVLHHFSGPDGQGPVGGLTLGTDGSYYGASDSGGLYSRGTIFKITAGGTLTTLYSFTGGADGSNPEGAPIEGFDGNFYGPTRGGSTSSDYGSVYKITPSGAFTVLRTFSILDGVGPIGSLVQAPDGYFYGTTQFGGAHNLGTIFRISSSGYFKTLHNFDGTHGSYPYGLLIQASDGNFYGNGSNGGSAAGNVVFKITPAGTYTVLHYFTCGSDGCNQAGSLMQATDGNIYGTNNLGGAAGWGVLFRIALNGTFKVLHNFDWNTGASPQATLLQHTNGVLYSTTTVGGVGNGGDGTFYSFDVGLGPFVRFLPVGANVGAKVEFLGQGFTGTSAVSFNGTAAAFKVASDTYLTATVPIGATTGLVTVTTPGGALFSDKEFIISPLAANLNLRAIPYPTPTVMGGLLTYAFKVWNESSVQAVHEVLTTQVPPGTTFSSLKLSGTAGLGSCTTPSVGASGTVLCEENSVMRPGSTWTIRLTVQITAPAGTVITENATASSDNLGSSTATAHNTVH